MKKQESLGRVLAALNGRSGDRPPVFDFLRNSDVIESVVGESLTPANRREMTIRTINQMLDAVVADFPLPEDLRIEEKDGFRIEIARWTKQIAGRPFATMEELSGWVKDQTNQYTGWGRELDDELDTMMADFQRKRRQLPDTVLFWSFADVGLGSAYHVCGLDGLWQLAVEDADLLSQWLEVRCDRSIEQIKHLPRPELSPAAFVGEDIAHQGGLLFPPDWLRREFFPRLKNLVAAYHRRGIKVIFHSDGTLWDVMDDLVECGIDGLHPVEAGMDLARLRRAYPSLVLIGGIDVGLLTFGTPSQIRQAVLAAIRAAGPSYMVGGSGDLEEGIPKENILAMWETAWNGGGS